MSRRTGLWLPRLAVCLILAMSFRAGAGEDFFDAPDYYADDDASGTLGSGFFDAPDDSFTGSAPAPSGGDDFFGSPDSSFAPAPSYDDSSAGYDGGLFGSDPGFDSDPDFSPGAGPGFGAGPGAGGNDSFFEDDDSFFSDGPGGGADPLYANVDGPDADGTMVTEIEVLNTITTTPDQIIYRMSTRVGHPLNERTLDGDFQRLAGMGVFDDIQIRKEFVQGGVKIIVAVREKDVIRRIEFTGNQQVKARKLGTLIESKVGERYDAGKGNRDRRAIEDYLHKEYYYFGEVDVVTEPYEDGIRLVFNLDEGGRLYVADILFRGNTVFTRKLLLSKMETKRSGLISRGKYLRRAFERDLERIRMNYLDEGYLDVRVIERPFEITANTPKSRWQRRDAYVHIDIDEGEQYHVGSVNIEFVGTSLVREEDVRALIDTRPGAVYSPITIQEDARKIRDVYGMAPNSRYFTRVLPEPEVTEDGLIMDVTFRIQESPEVIVEGVRVTGLSTTKEFVVLREFELFPGEKIDSRKFNRSKENIENLGYFKERPTVEIREGSAPNRAILVAELEEIPTGRITAGVGVSSQDSVVGSVGVTQRNFDYRDRPKSLRDFYTGKSFRGAGQSFSANASAGSETQSYSVNFTNPWIYGKPISMSLSAYYNMYDYDDEYKERRMGASIIYGKRLFDIKELTINGGYRLELVQLSKFSSKYYSKEYQRAEGSHNVSRWVAGINYDSRDSVFEPTKGMELGANFELAGRAAGSSKDFWRAMFNGQYFIPFFVDSQDRNWSIGFRGDFSMAQAYGRGDGKGWEDEVPYYERFHAGGVGSVRGFDYRGISPRDRVDDNAMGGEAALTGAVEVFFPIWERIIRGSLFYDTGTTWRYLDKPGWKRGHDKNGYAQDTTDMKFRSSLGIGLHIKTPLGPQPVRLYYSFPMHKQKGDETQRFQFTMGALF